MRALITGCNGFIGRAVSSYFLERGWELFGIDRTGSVQEGLTGYFQADLGASSGFEDILSTQRTFDAVIHAAALIDKSPENPNIILANCLGTQRAIALAKSLEASSFIYLSSIQVIGSPDVLPITEKHPTSPLTAYHASKLFGEHLVHIATSDSFAGTVLRLTAPIGPSMPGNRILSAFVKKSAKGLPLELIGQGTRKQDYVDVRDIAAAVRLGIEKRISGVFNIASGRCISNIELAHLCVEVLGSSSDIVFKDTNDPEEGIAWDVSIARAKEHLGYTPEHTVEDTIRELGACNASGIH